MRCPVVVVALILSLALLPPALHAGTRGSAAEIARALAALRKDPGNPKLLTDAGSQFALRASEQGFPTDVEDSRKYLRQSLKMDPQNSHTVAWLGALRCIEAKVRQSKGFVKEGLGQLDHAVDMSPEDVLVRMVRGSVSVEVPREFNRVDGGVTDLEFVKAAYERDAHALAAYRIDPGEVFLKLGKGYRAKGNIEGARQMWTRAAGGPASRDRESAQRLLAKYGGPAKAPGQP
jgi:hypothetical protein